MSGLAGPGPRDPIPASASCTVCVQLLSGFLSQGKLIPLTMLLRTIEIELADQRDCFVGMADSLWETTRSRLVRSVCDLDQALANSYAKHLLDGKSLPLYMRGPYSAVNRAAPAGTAIIPCPSLGPLRTP